MKSCKREVQEGTKIVKQAKDRVLSFLGLCMERQGMSEE